MRSKTRIVLPEATGLAPMISGWSITPLWLLLAFFVAAACAFIAFALLTFCESTPGREDWKKFLAAFAGTALALSGGFGSLMLQQENQSQQKQTEELALTQRKLNEENGQMKARLLYSVAQKKFELQFFLVNRLLPKVIARICDPTLVRDERDERLRDISSPLDPTELQFMKETFEKLFSAGAYERNVLNRLMRETGFAARVTQGMLSHFLLVELELNVGGPNLLSQSIEFIAVDDSEVYCRHARKVQRTLGHLIRDVMKLQLSTCAAYALIGLPTEESVKQSAPILSRINGFDPGAEEGQPARIQEFLNDLVSSAGSARF